MEAFSFYKMNPLSMTKNFTFFLQFFLLLSVFQTAEESIDRANERVKKSTEDTFAQTAAGYSAVIPETSYVSFSNGKIIVRLDNSSDKIAELIKIAKED